jgi:hypothetical protein
MIGIDGALCGLDKHIVVGDKTSLAEARPAGCDWVGLSQNHADSGCVLTLLELEGASVDLAPPAGFAKMAATFGKAPWELVQPSRRFWWGVDKLKETAALVGSTQRSYHRDVFVPCTEVFASLTPWRVDPAMATLDDPMAPSFATADGWVSPPTYNRFGTRTGRLTVTDGPRVLTARQSTRAHLRAVDEDHLMVQFDFSCLEARVALGLAGKEVEPDADPYTAIAKLMNIEERDEAKRATFAALYSDPTAANQRDPRVSLARRVFKLGEYFITLKRSLDEVGSVRNFYGRLIPETIEATVYSNYVQSTACDVTLLGFRELASGLAAMGVKPHFLLHDALFASVPLTMLKDAARFSASGVKVPGFKLPFPIKASTTTGRPIL